MVTAANLKFLCSVYLVTFLRLGFSQFLRFENKSLILIFFFQTCNTRYLFHLHHRHTAGCQRDGEQGEDSFQKSLILKLESSIIFLVKEIRALKNAGSIKE
jgi:hypothetical protein